MAKFALKEITEVGGPIKFFALVKNGKCLFDNFATQIEKESSFANQLKSIYSTMDRLSRGVLVMPKHCHSITIPKNEKIKEFEVRSNDLRVYFIKDPTKGHIVILGGKKSTQDEDINSFRLLKNACINNI